MNELPIVTIIMPILNEAGFIERSLKTVLAQDYPSEQIEILLVDGISNDGTREIAQQMINDTSSSAVLLDNPARIVPTALNIGLQHANGEIIIRVDGHCEIAPDYVRRCVELLQETDADCVGGPIVTVGETRLARTIALAQSSFFGVGGVAFRTKFQKAGYVDTLAFGAYRCEVFESIGSFDEELIRNQDDEFNLRLTQAGGKIWLAPSIHSIYYSRTGLPGLWRQYFQYGYYKVRVIQKRKTVPSWRHLVPGGFVVGLIVSGLLAILTQQYYWLLSVIGPYAVANSLASLWTARRDWRILPWLPLTFLVLHLAYGLGFLQGVGAFTVRLSSFTRRQ